MVFKCKMCGAPLNVEENNTIVECEFCRSQQTLPKLDSDVKANLYDRANYYRRANEYDKAMSIYEQILNEDTTDAEAYWSIVLCRYGIEYVEDAVSQKRVPTINRMQFKSILVDSDYKQALNYADSEQKELYEKEAKQIDQIQKGIMEVSQKEEPFDIFICYKETNSEGERTIDSVLAQDLYNNLIKEGYKVFFARITLEDKLGSAYEPYIFSALNSSKVMVVVGTSKEHFNAVWVKNEWSRYLSLIAKGEEKVLIPAYKDINPYDLPEDFAHLQAQDMSKIGFMQDLLHGIQKIINKNNNKDQNASTTASSSYEPLIQRALMFLEDEKYSEANKYAERVLDINPTCAQAYVIKLLVELQLQHIEELAEYNGLFDKNQNYLRALKYADEDYRHKIAKYGEINRQRYYDYFYNQGIKYFNVNNYDNAIRYFHKIRGYKDADEKIYNSHYQLALIYMKNKLYAKAESEFATIPGYKDADILKNKCSKKNKAQSPVITKHVVKKIILLMCITLVVIIGILFFGYMILIEV